ncbi:hypothetical protein AXA44_01245 [Rhodococcus sp. SC4]|nr:hypothetical protein AXA44_01245 [Rhodococcus sp. SC4]
MPNEFGPWRLWTGILAPGIGILIHALGLALLGWHVVDPAGPPTEPAWWYPLTLVGLTIIAVRIIVLASVIVSSVGHRHRAHHSLK